MDYIDINTSFGISPKRNIDASIHTLKENMRKHNIAKSLTFSLRGQYYNWKQGNLETLEECEKESSLVPIAVFNPLKSINIKEDIGEIAEQGFVALRILSAKQAVGTQMICYRKAFMEADKAGLALMTECSPGDLYDIGKDFEIPIIFLSTHYYTLGETIAVLEDRKNFSIGARQLISPDAIEIFVERIGEDRLLFSTNSPFEYPSAATMMLEISQITEEQKAKIAYENAKRIFRL